MPENFKEELEKVAADEPAHEGPTADEIAALELAHAKGRSDVVSNSLRRVVDTSAELAACTKALDAAEKNGAPDDVKKAKLALSFAKQASGTAHAFRERAPLLAKAQLACVHCAAGLSRNERSLLLEMHARLASASEAQADLEPEERDLLAKISDLKAKNLL